MWRPSVLFVAAVAMIGCTTTETPAPPCAGAKCDAFGNDDRVEAYQKIPGITATEIAHYVQGTGALVLEWNLRSTALGADIRHNITLGEKYGLCDGVKFREQPILAYFCG